MYFRQPKHWLFSGSRNDQIVHTCMHAESIHKLAMLMIMQYANDVITTEYAKKLTMVVYMSATFICLWPLMQLKILC